MASLFSRLFGAQSTSQAAQGAVPDAKASRAAAMLALHSAGYARWTPRSMVALTQSGYERNAVVYRAVRMIAEAAASVPWLLFEGRSELHQHPLLDLFARPNPSEVGPAFLESVFTSLMLYGNAYVEAAMVEGVPYEFYSLRADRMSLVPGPKGWPMAYDYMVAGDKVRYFLDVPGVAPILHMKLTHPLDDHYGFAPLYAAQVPVDIHNAASYWNKALLDNSARPSGALVYAGASGHLSEEQFERLKGELDENFQGSRNAGRPLLLEGGLDWKPLSMTPKDMDFIEAKASAAREIALAFGVPPLLLGIKGDNTFSNYQEANRAFWRQTVIPLVSRTQKSFGAWIAPAWGGLRLDYNVDRIEALASERESEWKRVDSASFLTSDEKREALGYGALPKGAEPAPAAWAKRAEQGLELRYSPDQPRDDHGRWTSGGGAGAGQPTAEAGTPGGDGAAIAGAEGVDSLVGGATNDPYEKNKSDPAIAEMRGKPTPLFDPDGNPIMSVDNNNHPEHVHYPTNFPPQFFIDRGLEAKSRLAASPVDILSTSEPALEALTVIGNDLVKFRRSGPWDMQREGYGLIYHYVNYATVAIGLYSAAAEIPRPVILAIENMVATGSNFGTVDKDKFYTFLPLRNISNTDIGIELYKKIQRKKE